MKQGGKFVTALGRGFSRIPNAALPVIELLVLVAMLAGAWRERSAMPLVPTANPDTWGYLNPALTWLSGLGCQQTAGRDWLYPALLALFLKTTGTFAGIALWQKCLGIASGLLMAMTWRCWVGTLPLQRGARFLASLFGALPILVQLMNPQSMFFEMSIRPEAVLSFFVYAQFACLMGYYKYRWQKPGALASIVFGAAAIVLAYACLQLKPSWLFAFLLTSAPVFVGVFGRAPSITARLLAPALGIALSFLLLWLPSSVFLIKDSASITFLPATLFTIHARLIDQSLEAKLARMPDSDPEKPGLQTLVALLDHELHVAEHVPTAWEKLGFDPDYLYYHSPLIPAVYRYAGNDDKKFKTFCLSCYKDAALHDPWSFAGKIMVQFTHFLFPKPETFFKDRADFARFYQDSAAVLDPHPADPLRADVKRMYLQYKADLLTQASSGIRFASKFHSFRQVLAPLALPLEILFLGALAASLLLPPLRDLRLAGCAAATLFSAPLGNAVTVCIVHALDIERYRLTYGGFLLFALAAMAVFLALVITRLGERRGAPPKTLSS